MAYLVFVVVAVVTWVVLQKVPTRDPLMRIGIALAVAGALMTAGMWWMVFPEVMLVAGLVMVAVAALRSRSDPARTTP